jgi:hypothetical protein
LSPGHGKDDVHLIAEKAEDHRERLDDREHGYLEVNDGEGIDVAVVDLPQKLSDPAESILMRAEEDLGQVNEGAMPSDDWQAHLDRLLVLVRLPWGDLKIEFRWLASHVGAAWKEDEFGNKLEDIDVLRDDPATPVLLRNENKWSPA